MTVRRLLPILLAGIVVACATTGPGESARLRAQVTVVSLSPDSASGLQEESVIEATVEYTIDKFQASQDRYYLSIQFEQPNGGSFNHYRRFSDEPVLSSSHGLVRVKYPLSHIWADARLKKPIRMWFYVVERDGAHDSQVIGRAGPIDYAVK